MESSEILEAENDIEEAFLEVGTKNIQLLKLKKSESKQSVNLFGETEKYLYNEPISLIGIVNINPLSDDLSEVGKSLQCTVILTLGSKSLKENNLYTDGKLNIDTDDVFVYLGKRYEIKNITQSGILNDYVLIFGFECKELSKGRNYGK